MAETPARRIALAVGLAAAALLRSPAVRAAVPKPRCVQKRYFQVTAGGSVSVSLRRVPTAGDLLVAFVVWDNGDGVALADTTGNAWTPVVGRTSSGGTSAELFYAPDAIAGTDTVTATFATPVARGDLYVLEYSGIETTSPLAATVQASGSVATIDSGFVTAGSPNTLLLAANASNGIVKRQQRGWRSRARHYGNMVAERVPLVAGSYDFTATQTGTEWITQVAVFAPSGADTTPPSVPTNLQSSNVTSNSARISWTASTDAVGVVGYRVYRNASLIGTTGQTQYTDPNLSPVTTYAYAVAAYDAAGNVSAASTPLDVTTTSGPPGVVNPLKVGPTGRYLVGQNDLPFLITGDSPQALTVNLSEAEADAFFADRQAAGFNLVWVNLLCATYTGGRADGSTYDGIVPFTTPDDLATPNEAFFSRVDDMITLAAQHGLTVLLDPAETGSYLSVLNANGVAKARGYGQYLGTRYRSFDNIVWMSGNDFQSWPSPGDDAVVQAVAQGIRDTDDRHIHTVELDYPVSGSLDDPTWAPLIELNASYTYYPTYAQVLTDYDRPNAIPTFLVEANYEFEHNAADEGTPEILRRQAYWALLSGATGQLYGNHYTWPFASGWESNLDTPGSAEMRWVKQLFEPRQWWTLIPDQTHALVTAGYGTYADSGSLEANDYLTAALTPDGALGMAYMPTVRTVTIDMGRLGAAVQASWYDPSSGTFSTITGSPFPNTGSRSFTPSGPNAAGDGDWVLVLEAAVPADTQAPSVPGGLAVTGATSSEVDVSWAPANDNVAVAGYRVYRNGTVVRSTRATACADTGLTPSTSYSYTVVAFD